MHRRTPGRGNLPLLVVSIAVGLLVVVMVVDYAFPPARPQAEGTPLVSPPSLPSNLTGAHTQVLVPSGTVLTIQSGAFNDAVFGLAMPADLSGTFLSTAPVNSYLVTAASFQALETQQGSPIGIWSAGPANGGDVDASAPAGTWYLVFVSDASSGALTVEFTSSLLAVYPPPGQVPAA